MGALTSNLGTWAQRTAQDWLVLTELTNRDAASLGLVTTLQFAPQLALLPLTGAASDQLDRVRLLAALQAILAILSLGLGLLVLTDLVRLWHVYCVALASGCAAAFEATARHTFVAELVSEEDVHNAVALNSTIFTSAGIIGPALAGMLIASIGAGWLFVANGLSFLAVLVSLQKLDRRKLQPRELASRERGALLAGLRYVRDRTDLVVMFSMLLLLGMFGFQFGLLTTVMAVSVFGLSARGYGLLASALSAGTLAGAVATAHHERPTWRILITTTILFGAGCVGAALAPSAVVLALAFFVMGSAATAFANSTNGLTQLTTASHVRGRVTAIRLAVGVGGMALGAPLLGWVADEVAPRWTLGIAACSAFVAASLGAWYRRAAAR